jgi:hypothetical protein
MEMRIGGIIVINSDAIGPREGQQRKPKWVWGWPVVANGLTPRRILLPELTISTKRNVKVKRRLLRGHAQLVQNIATPALPSNFEL